MEARWENSRLTPKSTCEMSQSCLRLLQQSAIENHGLKKGLPTFNTGQN